MDTTHEVFNQPAPLTGYNLFETNRPLRDALKFNAPQLQLAPLEHLGASSGDGRDADPCAAGQHPPAGAAHPRPLRPPHRRGGVPSELSRADGGRGRRRPARHALDRRIAVAACRARGRLHAVHRARALDAVPDLDELCGDARAARQPGRVRRLGPEAREPLVRPGAQALARQAGRDHGHGHDREAGRLGRARQHHARRARRQRRLGRALRDHRPQVVLLGADVRCLPGPRAGAGRAVVLLPAARAAGRQPQRDPHPAPEGQARQQGQRQLRGRVPRRQRLAGGRGRARHSADPRDGHA